MGKAIKKQIQGMSWWARLSLVALLTLATTVFMYEGWYKPKQASAAIAVVGVSTPVFNTTAANPTTLSLPVPSGAIGDLLLLHVDHRYDATAYPTISGWTLLDGTASTTVNGQAIYWKVATAASESNVSVSIGTSGANGRSGGVIHRYSGVDTSAAPQITTAVGTTTASAVTATGVTTTVANSWIVTFMGYYGTGTIANPSGMTANYASANATNGPNISSAYQIIASPGATGNKASTSSLASWVAHMVVLKPAPTTTTPTITTPTAATITTTTATLGANVTSDGGDTITERGVVWNTSPTPTTANNKVTGTGTTGVYTVNASTLPAGTRIYYRGYAINSIGTAYSPEGSFYTEPSTQANTVTFSNITQTGMTVGWNRGNGTGVIVVMKSGSAVDTAPADGNDGYTAQAAFGTGSVTGGTNYVVYKGTGTAVTVTGLTASTTYHVAVYEYSGSGNDASPALGINYLLTPATANQATASPCAAGTPTALTVGTETTSSVPLTWTTGASTDYFIVYRNGSQYATNLLTPSFTDNSVTPGAAYTYAVSGYNNAGTCSSAQTSAANAYVIPLVPSIPTTANPGTGTTLNVSIGTDTNDSSVLYAIRVNGTQYVQSSGALGGTAFWQSKSNWGTKTVTGLTANTDYTFDVAARNINPTPDTTTYGPSKLQRTTITMPTTITSCGGCHENPPTDTGISSRSAGEFAGSHSKHAVTLGQACTSCHVDNGASYNHSNGLIQMAGNGDSYTKGTSFAINNAATLSGGTCSNLYCHSNGTGGTSQAGETRPLQSLTTPNWGGTTSCTSCHGYPPSYANYTRATVIAGSKANAHQGTTHAAQACTVCHDTTTGNHGNGLYSINGSLGYTYNARRGGTCATAGCHGSINWGGKLGCIDCHAAAMTTSAATQALDATVTSRAAVVGEFTNTWSHKRSFTGTPKVTSADCIVCHVEGNKSDGKTTAAHGNGYINLRDPDTGLNIKNVTFSGTPGSYTEGSTDVQFVRFKRDFSKRLELDPQWLEIAAVQQNHCLKCHDTDGANNANAQVPTTGLPLKPFGVTITGHSAPYDSNGNGNVVDVNKSFLTSNSSYHPVRGKNNNWFTHYSAAGATGGNMIAPWRGPFATRGASVNVTSWGYLISCWDCHAPAGTTYASGVVTRSVTAHGAAATLRGGIRAAGTTAATNLCLNCHKVAYATTAAQHGANSAFTSGASNMGTTTFNNCAFCHAFSAAGATQGTTAGSTSTLRPLRGEDAHGFNDRTAGTVGSKWATANVRPYGFIRNSLSILVPLSTTASGETISGTAAICTGTGGTCNNNMSGDVYGGGTY